MKVLKRIAWVLLWVFVGLVLLLFVVPVVTGPWNRRWGATDAEVAATLPGDEFIPQPTQRATRAVTIDAPPERVWPWIVQEGMGRAGWYTYDWFYRATGSDDFVDGHSSDRIVPELQALKLGDSIAINPAIRYEAVRFEPARVLTLVVVGDDGTRSGMDYVLRPVDYGRRTRLVLRIAASGPGSVWSSGPFEFGAFVMSRANLLGIKQRAEATGS